MMKTPLERRIIKEMKEWAEEIKVSPIYEVYVEVFLILEWRDDSVFKTKSDGTRWINEGIVKANKPRMSNIIYSAANDEFAQNNMTIRRMK